MSRKRPHRRRHQGRLPSAPAYEQWRPADVCAWAPACVLSPAWAVAGLVQHPSGRWAVGLSLVCEAHREAAWLELAEHSPPLVAPIENLAEVLAFCERFSREMERGLRRGA